MATILNLPVDTHQELSSILTDMNQDWQSPPCESMSAISSRFKSNDPKLYKVREGDLWSVSD
jgi:hypothetical protein